MPESNVRRLVIVVVASTGLAAAAGLGALRAGSLDPSFTDFEEAGFVDGASVNDTNPIGESVNISNVNNCVQAWRVGNAGPTTEDEEIVDLGADPHGKVWRVSQAGAFGSQGAAPHTPNNGTAAPITAGETGATNDAGCGPSTTANFYGELEFRSVTGASQAGLVFDVNASSHDTRHAFVRIVDDGDGFDLVFFETDDSGLFEGVNLDTSLSYTDWHSLGIEIQFVDGLNVDGTGNDIVNVYVNGTLVHAGTSWETLYRVTSIPSVRSVDRLMIRGNGEIVSQVGNGLYFDNVLVTEFCPAGNCSLPAPYTNVGGCIATELANHCSALTGVAKAQCNKEQQNFCFALFKNGGTQ